MKKWVKRLSAMLLVVMMVLSLLPISVLAEPDGEVPSSDSVESTSLTTDEADGETNEANGDIEETDSQASESEVVEVFPDEIPYVPEISLAANSKNTDSPTPATTDPLNTKKTVVSNGDGTYKITLEITGAMEEESHTETSSANVIVVLDVSTSMEQYMGNVTRLSAVKTAANLLVDAMPNAAGVEMALISFGGSVTTNQSWMTISSDADKTTFKNKVTGLTTNQGTNWTDALSTAKTMADSKKNSGDTDPTYIIFLTDGCPTTNKSNHNHGSEGTQLITDTCISDPLATMTAMVSAGYNVYGIYANTTSESTMPYSGSGRNKTYTGDSDPLKYVIRESGAAGYYNADSTSALEDVFTALAKTITESLGYSDVEVDDGVTAMSNTSASTTVSGEATGFVYTKDGEAWADAPEATVENGAVKWDLSEIGNLEKGVKYAVSFDVWPSQAAYDLVADLNNGITSYDDLTDAEKAQIGGDSVGGYYLLTNTYLNTYFTHKDTYYVANGDKGNNSMALAAEKISLEKLWPENMLDGYGDATYRDDAGDEKTADEITLNLTKDGENYLDVVVGKNEGWKKDDIYVSCGLMTVKDGVATVKETGHDYTVTEPESFSYYWDLIADVYHPMVINGTATLLVLDEKATSADNINSYEIEGKIYKKTDSSANTLQASNYRRSNLNLTKVVSTEGGQDGYFTYTATVKDANSTDGYVWFSAWDPEANATVKDTDWVTSGATAQEGDTGYWYATNGATVTFKIKAGWNVRFLNLYHGSEFSFEETGMPEYYEFEKAEAKAAYTFKDTTIGDSWRTIDSENKKVTGTIIEPNNSYTVTYTNKYEAFYIYHSGVAGNGNLEVIPMADVNEDGTYNLYAKTTPETLYGGYYLDYAGKGDYKDDGVAGTTGVAYTGMNYDWSGAQTVNGTAIKPVAGETYYIKEVPTYYLRNYHQINFMKVSKELKALYLISAIDDLNYKETGFILKGTGTENKPAKVVSNMTFKNYSTNKSVTLKANTVFKSLGITGTGSEKDYLTYFDATNSDYFKTGTFTVSPYWITPDGIDVYGSYIREITISEMTKSGITKIDRERE